MAFKIKKFISESPLNFDPKNPYANNRGNKSKYSPEKDTKIVSDYSSYNPKEHSRVRNYLAENKYKSAQGRLSTVKKTTPAPIDPSKPIQGPKQNVGFDTGFGKAGTDFVTGEKAVEEVKKRKTTTSNTKTPPRTRAKAKTIQAPKAKKIERTIEAPKASDVNVSKKPTVKTAPKDNSRKAIRKRKKADKAAGLSKSQIRANKAKSKSEKALAKSKATKDSVNKAHLKSKSERLAKRAKRKGGSPVKATGGPGDGVKMRTDAEILKQYPGAVKVKGKLNEFKYKGTTLNPSRYPVSDKGKTVKQAIKIKNKK